MKRTRGKLIVISGPSGVGKSTITKAVMGRLKDAYLSVSMTTRPQAPGEQDGRDYWFVSRDQFLKRIEGGLFLEYAEVFGNLYGTPRDKTDEALAAGRTVILEIDVQGGRQVKAIYPQAVMVFIMPPSSQTLAERIGRRGRESGDVVARRLRAAQNEIDAAALCYDNMVVNDDLDQAINEVIRIIENAPDA
ncbi:MAG TPA: guanylate kinase [Sedimentisphaerales bacterium]|nr:guanylate kinase [Sedimentisphaerales bacterium]HNU31233.1 guanylate kinase [Sedimentisphaerales bacterium]